MGHYSRPCPFKEDEQEKVKEKGSNPYNTVQGVDRTFTGMYSMHAGNDADNRKEDRSYESTDASNDDFEPTTGACFHQIYHHTKNKNGLLNMYCTPL